MGQGDGSPAGRRRNGIFFSRRAMLETALSVWLTVWCFYVYWQIHFRRLDYSCDTSFLGFVTTTTTEEGGGGVNECSRWHVMVGVA